MMNSHVALQELLRAIADRVRTRRKALGFTQEQLAEKADLSVTFIAKLEGGNKTPSLETLLKLSTALDVDIADLLGAQKKPIDTNRANSLTYAFAGLDDTDASFAEQELLHLISYLRKRRS